MRKGWVAPQTEWGGGNHGSTLALSVAARAHDVSPRSPLLAASRLPAASPLACDAPCCRVAPTCVLAGRRVLVEDWDTFYSEAEKLYVEHPAHVRNPQPGLGRHHSLIASLASADTVRHEISALRRQARAEGHQRPRGASPTHPAPPRPAWLRAVGHWPRRTGTDSRGRCLLTRSASNSRRTRRRTSSGSRSSTASSSLTCAARTRTLIPSWMVSSPRRSAPCEP